MLNWQSTDLKLAPLQRSLGGRGKQGTEQAQSDQESNLRMVRLKLQPGCLHCPVHVAPAQAVGGSMPPAVPILAPYLWHLPPFSVSVTSLLQDNNKSPNAS